MMAWELEASVRLLVAAILGALIGIEREHHGRSAGFRTQMLVALGSALAMIVSLSFAREFAGAGQTPGVSVDPARVAVAVMSGIGFLGAGAIVRYGVNIRGLTTAASLWCTAAVGLACGFGLYIVAGVATGLALIILLVLAKLNSVLQTQRYKSVTVTVCSSGQDNVTRFKELLAKQGVTLIDYEYENDFEKGVETLTLHVRIASRTNSNHSRWFSNQDDVIRFAVR